MYIHHTSVRFPTLQALSGMGEGGEGADDLTRGQRSLTHPDVVHDLDSLLEIYRDVHCDVMVETGTHRELLWERRPVVFPT